MKKTTRRTARFRVFQAKSSKKPTAGNKRWKERKRQYYVTLIAANGEKILQSEGYTSRSGAHSATFGIMSAAAFEWNFKDEWSKDGRAYFTLRSRNNKVVGTSQMYGVKWAYETPRSKRAAVRIRGRGVRAVMRAVKQIQSKMRK